MTKKKKWIDPYRKLPNSPGIKKHCKSGRYQASKTIDGKTHRETFDSVREARRWRNTFNGDKTRNREEIQFSTLKEVWEEKQHRHFPTLAKSTQEIWHRRYELWKSIEHLPMNQITSSKVTSWIEENVEYYTSDFYIGSSRGRAKRCNLSNELNLFTTIFNWYKRCEVFEEEARYLTNPISTAHKKLGFIRAKPIKEMSISLDDVIVFFRCLKPLYKDLAMLQYFTASRIGEVAGLQWDRVQFDRKKLTIMETCRWDMQKKTFIELNPHPKNKEPRPMFITPEIEEILKRRLMHKEDDSDFVFHVEGQPLNYATIQLNYREALRKAGLPHTGTHMLRHGMAKLARRVGGGLDAVIAMTGHKDFKLADHYSKLDTEFQQETALKLSKKIRAKLDDSMPELDSNVISLDHFRAK